MTRIMGETEAERIRLEAMGACAKAREELRADLLKRHPRLGDPLRVWWKASPRTDRIGWDLVQLAKPIGDDGALDDVVHVHASVWVAEAPDTITRGAVLTCVALDHDRRAKMRKVAYIGAGALAAASVAAVSLFGG
jgi:hypothetical protein